MVLRIALANLPFPEGAADSVERAAAAIAEAGAAGARVLCFPECYVPGYRVAGRALAPPDEAGLESAWTELGGAAAQAKVAVVLGTERVCGGRPVPSALVLDPRGARLGFQDKVQLDPSEEPVYGAGTTRRVFAIEGLTFGIAICHEGWRYPETVRFAARRGAQVVFHLQYHAAEPGSYRPSRYADPANSFHEKALLCRAAENTCFVASANYAGEGSPTTSAVVGPDGALLAWQPYGEAGLLIADLELARATGLLARRLVPVTERE